MSSLQFNDFDILNQVLDFMRSKDCFPVDNTNLILDGYIHRYRVQGDKKSQLSGAYCIHTDGIPAGWIEDWHTGQPINWCYDMSALSQEQREYFNSDDFRKKAEAIRLLHEEERKRRQAEAAERSRILWEDISDAPPSFPYFQDKQINPYGTKFFDGKIAVPLRNINGTVLSIQWIDREGNKRFQQDASIDGLFWSVGLDILVDFPDSTILLGEGFATMAKVYELTGLPSVAAISCYSLMKVAQILKNKYSKSKIIILADNDRDTEIARGFNPGISHARNAVMAGFALDYIAPTFPDNSQGTDWDDFALAFGEQNTADILLQKIRWACMTDKEKREFNTRKSLSDITHNLDPTVQLPPQEFIGGLFPRKFVSLLVAPPGTGKTIFMQKFVSDVSIGGSIFDGFAEDEPQRTCLILAGEAGYELLTRRGASMKWPIKPERVKVLDQYEAEIKDIPIMLDDNEGWLNVLRLVDMYKPDILFIDTFSSFHDKDENKATEMKPIIKKLATLARDNNIAVVPIHHSRKRLAKERSLSLNQDDVIGSSIINRLVGLIIGIEPMKEDEKLLLVRPLKSWFSTFMPFTYTLKENFYGGTVVQTDLAPASVNNSKIAVWNYLRLNFAPGEWFSRAQVILSEIEGNISERQVRSVLSEFVKLGKLQRRGNTKISEYSIAEK